MFLYDKSTGEIRARVFDQDNQEITNATVVCTLHDSNLRPTTVFSNRSMSYSASHPFEDPSDVGCYFCTVAASEIQGPDGLWQAVVTATDSLSNTLTINGYIEVLPFVAS